MRTTNMIVDLQFGSTGKGLLAGFLAKRTEPDVVASAWMPNAGHTFIDRAGNRHVHTMLPNGIVSPCCEAVLLGPGSVINLESLCREMQARSEDGTLKTGVMVIVHPAAVPIHNEYIHWEEEYLCKNGSTRKGSGAAQIARIRRAVDQPTTIGQLLTEYSEGHLDDGYIAEYPGLRELYEKWLGQVVFCRHDMYDNCLQSAQRLQIEGAQGYSLSVYHGEYPYTTSRDVTPAQIAADVALPLCRIKEMRVYGCARTFPIRVNNREGYSGPGYKDQRELDWGDVGVEPELTTVTRLPRRIFTFSFEQIREAAWRCGVHSIFLNFANYLQDRPLSPGFYGPDLSRLIHNIEIEAAPVRWLGWGPGEGDVETRARKEDA